jgi:hypothetical protein
VDLTLLFWRRLINSAVADACRTLYGAPTDNAIMARYWIDEMQPHQTESAGWSVSFECACGWLSLDVATERARLVGLVDDAWMAAAAKHLQAALKLRRAAVLSCAGVMITSPGQAELPLVSEADYEDVAGIEHGDPLYAKMPPPHVPVDRGGVRI